MTARGRDRVPAGRHPKLPGEEDSWLLPVLRVCLVIGVSGRDWLAVCRTTGCREQPISDQGWLERVLETASRSLPETPITEPMRNTRNDYLSARPEGVGCLPAGTRSLPLAIITA